MGLCNASSRKLRRGERLGCRATPQCERLVACKTRGCRSLPICPGAPDGGHEDTDDLEVDVQGDDVNNVEDIRHAEGEDYDDDVENDGENEVEDGDPEKGFQTSRVRV